MDKDLLTFYKSGLRRQWRWRFQAAGNRAKLANGGESYNKLADAEASAFRVLNLDDSDTGRGFARRRGGQGETIEVEYK